MFTCNQIPLLFRKAEAESIPIEQITKFVRENTTIFRFPQAHIFLGSQQVLPLRRKNAIHPTPFPKLCIGR